MGKRKPTCVHSCHRPRLPGLDFCYHHSRMVEIEDEMNRLRADLSRLSRTCDGGCDHAKRIMDEQEDMASEGERWMLYHWDQDGESGWRLRMSTPTQDYWLDVTHCLCGGRLEAPDG